MTTSEFISKLLKDKAFMLEVCKHIPPEMRKSKDGKDEYQPEPGEEGDDVMAKMFLPGAQAMGVETTQDELAAELEAQLAKLGNFSKIRWMFRFFRMVGKTN